MTDTITESFCERCGTRYSLGAGRRRGRLGRGGLGRVRVLTRGLRNYVSNDGLPLDEAMAEARQDEERSSVAEQLEAFHRAFNFCMSCRQYTCESCWNPVAGECLTCAPDASRDVPRPAPEAAVEPADGTNGHRDLVEADAWPRIDLDRWPEPAVEATAAPGDAASAEEAETPDILARLDSYVAVGPARAHPPELTPDELADIEGALAGARAAPALEPAVEPGPPPAPEPVAAAAEPEAVPQVAAEPEPVPDVAAEPEVAAEPAPAAETEIEVAEAVVEAEAAAPPAPVAQPEPARAASTLAGESPADRATAARRETRSLLGRFRPPKPSPAEQAVAAATRPSTVPAPTPEVPAPAAAPTPAHTPAPTAPVAPVDVVDQPTWRITAPDTGDAVPPSWPAPPAWSDTSGPRPPYPVALPTAWASRLATARPEASAGVWAASAQEVLGGAPAVPGRSAAPAVPGRSAAPAVQSCVSCGLSLSANARFCRRCGSRQG